MTVSSFVFYGAYGRLKVLNELVSTGCHEVLECLNLYKRIVDSLENSEKVFERVYLLALVWKVGDILYVVYSLLVRIHLKRNVLFYLDVVDYSFTFILLSLPAISAGFLADVTEKLQLSIQDRILLERNGDQEVNLIQLSDYVSARGLRVHLARLLRLDWPLPLHILNLCVAYQIIIVQFTHLF